MRILVATLQELTYNYYLILGYHNVREKTSKFLSKKTMILSILVNYQHNNNTINTTLLICDVHLIDSIALIYC